MNMFKETTRDKQRLLECMESLDKLGKSYTVRNTIVELTIGDPGYTERLIEWTVEEVTPRMSNEGEFNPRDRALKRIKIDVHIGEDVENVIGEIRKHLTNRLIDKSVGIDLNLV